MVMHACAGLPSPGAQIELMVSTAHRPLWHASLTGITDEKGVHPSPLVTLGNPCACHECMPHPTGKPLGPRLTHQLVWSIMCVHNGILFRSPAALAASGRLHAAWLGKSARASLLARRRCRQHLVLARFAHHPAQHILVDAQFVVDVPDRVRPQHEGHLPNVRLQR